MPSREHNALLTRVGRGTPMGDVLRRYWIPALLSRKRRNPTARPCASSSWAKSSLRAAEGVVPRDADLREVLTPDMRTTEILQTV